MADQAKQARPDDLMTAQPQRAPAVDHLGNLDLRDRIIASRAHRARQAAQRAKLGEPQASAAKAASGPSPEVDSGDADVMSRNQSLADGDVNARSEAKADVAADKQADAAARQAGHALCDEIEAALDNELPPRLELERIAMLDNEKLPAAKRLLGDDPRVVELAQRLAARREAAAQGVRESVEAIVEEIDEVDPNELYAETTLAALRQRAAPFFEVAEVAGTLRVRELVPALEAALAGKSEEIARREDPDVVAAVESAPLTAPGDQAKAQRAHMKTMAQRAAKENEIVFELLHLVTDDMRDFALEKSLKATAKAHGFGALSEKVGEGVAKAVKFTIEQLDVSVERLRAHNLSQILLEIDNQDDGAIATAFESWQQNQPAFLAMLHDLDPAQGNRWLVTQAMIDLGTAAGSAASSAFDGAAALPDKLPGNQPKQADDGVVEAPSQPGVGEAAEGEEAEHESDGTLDGDIDAELEHHDRLAAAGKSVEGELVEGGVEYVLKKIVGSPELEGSMQTVNKAIPILIEKVRAIPELLEKIEELRRFDVDLSISSRELTHAKPAS